ncbi:MAG: flagellar export chaperone FliS [Phycisphaerales bacterium JB039]
MTDATTTNAYLRTKVLTASPEELRLMLLDGAIRFAHMGREGLAKRDFEQSYNGISQCRAIVMELMTSIRREHNPELAERVHSVYVFLFNELVNVSMEKDVARMDKVIELLEFERETWALLMEKLRRERGGGAAAPTPEGIGSLSVQA